MADPGGARPQPPNPDRRKLLLVGGFGAASAFILNRMGVRSDPSEAATTRVTRLEERTPAGPASIDGAQPPPAGHVFDRVVSGGRVIDPASGYDAVAHVGIDGDRITAISAEPLTGRAAIDATGLVVAPGFIDVLSYEPVDHGTWFKISDGVTTNLAMHGINNTAAGFFQQYGPEGVRPPVHYGGAFDDSWMREYRVDVGTRAATSSQIEALQAELSESIGQGYIGLSVELEYTPWVTDEEVTALAQVAAQHQLPLFSHLRWSSPGTPQEGSLAAIDELLGVAERTGIAVHIDHITSMATHVMGEAIAKVDDARGRGLDVTACVYPYDFWATTLASNRFAPGWQERFRITYDDLEVPGTGERLTEYSFAQHQRDNTLVAAHAIPEDDVRAALQTPWVMIGSDAILEPGNNNHPRATGCFTRTLGRYVRELGVLSLPDALAKMTILPARRLEARVPSLRRKGRLQMGADADVTIFDPATVIDRSTISDPAQHAEGVRYVLVSGQLVKEGETLHTDVRPGQPIMAEI